MKFSKTYQEQDIPEPYYYGQDNFELVMDMLEDACQGLLERLNDAWLEIEVEAIIHPIFTTQ